MSSFPPLPDDDDLLAAEMAFGLLDDEDRRTAEARLAGDPAFAAACRHWQERATTLAIDVDQEPPAAIWAAITAKLPANDLAAVPLARLRFWQGMAGVAAAAAIVFGVILTRPSTRPLPPMVAGATTPPLVAVLSDPAREAVVTVSVDRGSPVIAVAPVRLDPGRGDAELWVIPRDGRPRAIGIVDARRRATLHVAPQIASVVQAGATLAVSLEPRGGSSTGLPTGPVILTGKIAQS